jgi:AAHS family 4-hydroxybenzoate transporter-like MFS transporter
MTMAAPQSFDIDELVDNQKVRALNIFVLALSFFIMLADGYDLKAAAFAAPLVIKDWGIDRAAFAPVFSACPLGMLFGAPLFGQFGDRFGRKKAIVFASGLYGAFTLASALATNLDHLVWMRFLTGLAMGGILPNIVALNAEFAPKRYRATMIVMVLMGITMGDALPAAVTAFLAPEFGWQVIFWIGGALGLGGGVAAWLFLPESLKYMAARGGQDVQLTKLARRIRPDLQILDGSVFRMAEVAPTKAQTVLALFGGGLALVTVALWITNAANLMSNYFLSSWMPTLFHDAGLSVQEMALASSMYYVGAVVGGLVVSRLIDRWGIGIVIGLFLLGCPAVAMIGAPGLGEGALMASVFLAGFSILGAQMAINATSGLIYSTRLRAKGVGWSNSIGRLGAISGPMIGGGMLALGLSNQTFFLAAVVPLLIGAVGSTVLFVALRRRSEAAQAVAQPSGVVS